MKKAVATLALLCAAAAASAQTTITISTGFSNAGPQLTPEEYKFAVEAAVANPTAGYGTRQVPVFDNISNHSLFGGPHQDIAYKMTVDFHVGATDAGYWQFRGGVDFGNGGVLMIDDIVIAFSSHDLSWDGSYDLPWEILEGGLELGEGMHQLVFYGLETCCDTSQQAQYRIGDGTYTTFSAMPVPEPASYAMLLAGLAAGALVRRRATRTAS